MLASTAASSRSFASSSSSSSEKKVLSLENLNPKLLRAEYAVRGELVIRAEEHVKALADPQKKGQLPFEEVIFCNIGNPQQLNQKPITFFRQVASLMEYPELLNSERAKDIFPEDAIARAKALLSKVPGGVGAYSNSQGLPAVREHVSQFIEERDGYPSDPSDIFLTEGASGGVVALLNCLLRGKQDGVMIPIPQYPLYSATIPLLGGSQLEYYLDEENGWSLKVEELDQVVKKAKEDGIEARALVIINPGNPTGQCLEPANMREIIDFCHRNKVLLFADEVYQVNAYAKPFYSFKKILRDMQQERPELNGFELASFHSVSKGVIGECGKRGGYMEIVGFDPAVKAQLYKLASISLCPNLPGQIMVDLMVKPPQEGEPSYPLYHQETSAIFASLQRRAATLSAALNRMEGVSCNQAEGAMYLFPRIRLPAKAVEAAKQKGKAADVMYAIDLLDATGVCVVPGSGFGQKEGTLHFRTTFLPPEEKIEGVVERMAAFHKEWMRKWSSSQ
ncbi:alanine transaminase [Balamuthia mandrillaris]